MLVKMETQAAGGGSNYYDEFAASEISTSAYATRDFGFVPTEVILYFNYNNNALVMDYDVKNNKRYRTYTNGYKTDMGTTWDNLVSMDGTTLKYKAADANCCVRTTIIAIKD